MSKLLHYRKSVITLGSLSIVVLSFIMFNYSPRSVTAQVISPPEVTTSCREPSTLDASDTSGIGGGYIYRTMEFAIFMPPYSQLGNVTKTGPNISNLCNVDDRYMDLYGQAADQIYVGFHPDWKPSFSAYPDVPVVPTFLAATPSLYGASNGYHAAFTDDAGAMRLDASYGYDIIWCNAMGDRISAACGPDIYGAGTGATNPNAYKGAGYLFSNNNSPTTTPPSCVNVQYTLTSGVGVKDCQSAWQLWLTRFGTPANGDITPTIKKDGRGYLKNFNFYLLAKNTWAGGFGTSTRLSARYPQRNATCTVSSNSINLNVGGSATVSLNFRNTGKSTWYKNTDTDGGPKHYIESQGTNFGLTNTIALPSVSVGPNSTASYSLNIVAPNTVGTYTLDYRMIQSNAGAFGGTCPVTVNVSKPPPALTYNYSPGGPIATSAVPAIPPSTIAKFYPGYGYMVTGSVSNSGTGTGPTYSQTLASGSYNKVFSGQSGLGSGNSRANSTTSRYFTVPNVADGTIVSCNNSVTPANGSVSPLTGSSTTQSAFNANCLTVYNTRYNIDDLDSSNVNISPAVINPSSSFTVTVDTCNTENVSTPSIAGIAPGVITKIVPSTNVAGTAIVSAVTDINRGVGSCIRYEFAGTVAPTISLGQQACVDISIDKDTGFSDGFASTGSQSYQACATVAEQAYLAVNNSSVWAGGGFDPAPNGYGTGWCSVSGGQANGFISTAQKTNIGNTIGAYTEYSAGATGVLEKFSSSTMPTVPLPVAVDTTNRLTFANTPSLGNFNAQGRCITDLYKYLSHDTTKTGISATTPPGAFPSVSGQYFNGTTTNMTISAQTIATSKHITLIVDGDVTINNNIAYGNYTASTNADIPSFILVATGNINIANAVTRLDGLYFSKGTINTCSDVSGNLNKDDCSKQLVINGSFVANDIQFRRTHGGVAGLNGSTDPAEVFNFSNEMYLAEPNLISDFPVQLGIDSLVDKPPVIN